MKTLGDLVQKLDRVKELRKDIAAIQRKLDNKWCGDYAYAYAYDRYINERDTAQQLLDQLLAEPITEDDL